eukprot:TRINITY_DN5560_c0_g1_i1.p1 TRINITY_DN5560_c0_g1~~TRINITY_DN5560_c0_g1_i1.p1  ORF type:complete len:1458 (+),score=469.08 TRINITY_DN5560_c0_g1_i1:50-4423(+)
MPLTAAAKSRHPALPPADNGWEGTFGARWRSGRASSPRTRSGDHADELRRELEAKDVRLREMQAQVTELLKYKEQAWNRHADVLMLNDQLRRREDDQRRLASGIQDMMDANDGTQAALHDRCARFEFAAEHLKRSCAEKVQDLEAHIQALKSDADRQTRSNTMLQQELAAMQRAVQAERASRSEREQTLQHNLDRANELTQAARGQLQEQSAAAARAEATAAALRRDLSQKESQLTEAAAAEERARARDAEQQARITQLTVQGAEAEERSRLLASDAEVIPVLRAELADSMRERQELEVVRQQLRIAEQQLRRSKDGTQRLVEENARLNDRGASTEEELTAARAALATAESVSAELSGARRTIDLQAAELAEVKDRAAALATELREEKDGRRSADGQHAASISELEREMTSVAAALQAGMACGATAVSLDRALPSELPAAVQQAVGALRQRAAAVCAECAQLRLQCTDHTERVAAQQTLAQQLARDRDDLVRDHNSLLARHEDAARTARTAEESVRRTETELAVSRSEAASLKQQLTSRLDSLVAALQQVATVDSAAAGDEASEQPPALRLSKVAGDEHALSYDTVLWKLTDFHTASTQYITRLRSRCGSLQRRAEEAEAACVDLRREVAEETEALRTQGRADEERHQKELRSQKETLTEALTSQLGAATLKLRAADRDAAQLRVDKRELELQVQQARADEDRAQQAHRRIAAEAAHQQRLTEDAEKRAAESAADAVQNLQAATAAAADASSMREAVRAAEEAARQRDKELADAKGANDALHQRAAVAAAAAEAATARLREEADRLSQRAAAAEQAADAAQVQSQHWRSQHSAVEDDVRRLANECRSATGAADESRLEAARMWGCVRLLVRALVPLRRRCSDLQAQRRSLVLWCRELSQALAVLRRETRSALADAGVESPKLGCWRTASGEQVTSLRSVAVAIIAAQRLARAPSTGVRCTANAGSDGRVVWLLPQDAVAAVVPPGGMPFPPSGARAVKAADGQISWSTTALEDASGVAAVLHALAPGAGEAATGSGELCELTRRLCTGLRGHVDRLAAGAAAAKQLPLQQARSTSRQVGQHLRALKTQILQSERTAEQDARERRRLQQQQREQTEAVTSLQKQVEALSRERDRMVPVDEVVRLESNLTTRAAALESANAECRAAGVQVESLRSELERERRRGETLEAERGEVAAERDQVKRALNIKLEESDGLTESLKRRAQLAVEARREHSEEMAVTKLQLQRRAAEARHLGAALEHRSQEARLLGEQLTDHMLRGPLVSSADMDIGDGRWDGRRYSAPSRSLLSSDGAILPERRRRSAAVPGRFGDGRASPPLLASPPRPTRLSPAESAVRAAADQPPASSFSTHTVAAALYRSGASQLLLDTTQAPAGTHAAAHTSSVLLHDPVADVLSYINALDEQVESTLQRSRAVDAGGPQPCIPMHRSRSPPRSGQSRLD